MLAERAYAKINLTLDVLGKRPDGYHDVNMVMQTIDLSDLIWLEETDREIEMDSQASSIPLDDRNLAVVAAKVFQEQSGIRRGVRIGLEKQIPVAAGLAGGSTDAAAVLRGLNRLWETGFTVEQLAEMGASVGSDVPFCVYGGCAVAQGRGEQLTRVEHDLKAWVVLVRPSVFVSTADIYNNLVPAYYSTSISSFEMVKHLQADDLDAVANSISNCLEAVTMRLYPEVAEVKRRFEHLVEGPVHQTGSGPTLYWLTRNRSAARRVYHSLRGFSKDVYLCRIL